ncbi:CPBP family glutamic-type intramembrane protease [Pseudoflavonifractor sp. An85]|uniref:CPBP family intramembrane glutamic endopeptidase n=1 Tax=Pseudoflavonifractor sp. An85 TaxID=1965661 RepID=UPI000B378857|nr:CPBP family glutamic-type intramembrane protease [Pseudoflavonifractor sp. An85]OUN25807.1 hypothetical protein B5G37_03060 [Pseudoflavonifractor sp. An85]
MDRRENHILNLTVVVVVVLLVNLAVGEIPYGVSFIYNGLILWMSVAYLKQDFDIDIRTPQGFSVKTVLSAAGLALLFAAAVVLFFFVFGEVSLFPPYRIRISQLVLLLVLQLVVAFSEEALFRFYLYEWLHANMRNRWGPIVIASLLFALLHFVTGGIIKQTVISFVFSVYAFAIKRSKIGCPYYLCSMTHFLYNMCAFFVFSI